MGKTKIKIFDESAKEVKKKKPSKKEIPVIASDAEQSESERGNLDEKLIEITMEPMAPRNDKPKKAQKPARPADEPGKAKPRSKKYQAASQDLDKLRSYSINEAVEIIKKLSYSKFTGTMEAHINTVQTGIRGLVSLPFSVGKKLKIVAFGKGADASGADVAGTDETIEEVNKGKVDFDLVITTPDWMPKLAKVARILGPRGLMPNPKNGTITQDLQKTVESFQAGKTEYKTEPKAPVIHLPLGKLDQPTEELSANITTLLQTLGKSRIKKVSISPTIGPSVKVDLASI